MPDPGPAIVAPPAPTVVGGTSVRRTAPVLVAFQYNKDDPPDTIPGLVKPGAKGCPPSYALPGSDALYLIPKTAAWVGRPDTGCVVFDGDYVVFHDGIPSRVTAEEFATTYVPVVVPENMVTVVNVEVATVVADSIDAVVPEAVAPTPAAPVPSPVTNTPVTKKKP